MRSLSTVTAQYHSSFDADVFAAIPTDTVLDQIAILFRDVPQNQPTREKPNFLKVILTSVDIFPIAEFH